MSENPVKSNKKINFLKRKPIYVYPTGRAGSRTEDLIKPSRENVTARASSFFFISKKFESLDYTRILNILEVERENTLNYQSVIKENILRVLYYCISGVGTAFIGTFVAFSIMKLGSWKYDFLSTYINDNYNGSLLDRASMTGFWFLGSIIPIMLGSSLVVFLAPNMAGGGVAQCVGYLNGVHVPGILSIKGLLVKIVATICCCISGLAGGKEGPMMHIGSIVGGSLPSALPWQLYKTDYERRNLAAAGLAAGLNVAFGAPIGGLLMALEEGISFWDISLMWNMYICVIVSYFVSSALLSVCIGDPGNLNNPDLLTLGEISSDVTEYELFELGLCAITGIIGGLIGTSVILIHTHITSYRMRFRNTRLRKLLESFLVACIVATLSLTAVMTVRYCSSEDTLKIDAYENMTRHTDQLYCKEGEYSDLSLLFFQTQEGVIHSLLRTDHVCIFPLVVYFIIYYILMCLTMGLSISAGVFVPQIVLGGAWGRIFGLVLVQMFPNAQWAKPSKYAYLGAAAQLSGVVGKTLSILLVLVEASSSITFSIPLMVTVVFAKYTLGFFVMPVYETQMHQMGIPFLPNQPPPLSSSILTTEVMSDPPLVTLTMSPTVERVVDVLKTTTHNGFPIVDTKEVLGLITRQQLLILLMYEAYRYPTPQTPSERRDCLNLFYKYARKHLSIQNISVDPSYNTMTLDLTPYYNPYPHTIHESLPLPNTYNLFRSLGLRYIIVLNQSNEPVGMVTRKDLAKFHTWRIMCREGVKEMLIKP